MGPPLIGALLRLVQVGALTTAPVVDSAYATAALRAVVERAAVENRRVPTALAAYSADIESELAIIARDTLDRELNANPQQVAGRVTWTADSGALVRLWAFRAPPLGIPFALTGVVRNWFTPTLYGERIQLGFDVAFGVAQDAGGRTRTVRGSVHPLATDRERYYRYAGGDTAMTIVYGGRRIPVIRILVTPREEMKGRVGIFEGEIDLDATRSQIVRLRGRFAQISVLGIQEQLYADLQNAEVDSAYWLPAYQRIEAHASMWWSDTRATLRAVSVVHDYRVTSDSSRVSSSAPMAASRSASVRMQTAFTDSATAHQDWSLPLGAMTSRPQSADFDDVGPEGQRPTGAPSLALATTRADHLLHFNRVEGLYTGLEAALSFRDLAPGVVARAFGGWAWTERTARGGATLTRSTPHAVTGLAVERALLSTNDFTWRASGVPERYGSLIGSFDDNDYVDRQSARAWLTYDPAATRRSLFTARVEVGREHGETSRLTHGLLSSGRRFRPNRNAATGGFVLGGIDYEIRSASLGNAGRGAVGGRVRYEVATGALAWQRAEASVLSHRSYGDALTIALLANAGMVRASVIPPQQLFELSTTDALSSYAYKQYAGDHAASGRGIANLSAPVWRRPLRVGRVTLPGVHPGIGASIESGWAELSSSSARMAAAQLVAGDTLHTIPLGTGRVRAAAIVGVSLFSGTILIGVARPIDHVGPWRLAIGVGFLEDE